MTPHLHSCSHSLMFSSLQKDDTMSRRLPELVAECTAKQWPMRNMRAYSHHSSSSSSSLINSIQNLVGRDPSKMRIEVNSQDNVQKTQTSGKEKLVLSGTERSVALKGQKIQR